MKIFIPTKNKDSIGGGWTFMKNFISGMKRYYKDVEFVGSLEECDILLISGVTLVDPDTVTKASQLGKKIVFRVDNIPRKSRNKRSRVYSNMRTFAESADMVVFQSEWAQMYAGFLTGNGLLNSMVIYNGVDKDIFYPGPEFESSDYKSLKYLYVQSQKNENKRFAEAAYIFHMRWRKDHNIKLTILGEFPSDLVSADFDFFAGENIEYLGVVPDRKMLADIYRDHDILLFPAFADASPNTVLEARACGLLVEGVNDVGGTKELLEDGLDITLERMCQDYYSLFSFLMTDVKEVSV